MFIDPISHNAFRSMSMAMNEPGQGLLALMYHSIGSVETSGYPWGVSLDNLHNQLYLLKKEEWNSFCVSALQHPEKLHPRSLAITFDDGYVDVYEKAFPLLKEFGFCATCFVVAGDIGVPSSWHESDMPPLPIMDRQQLKELSSAGIEIGAHTRTHKRLTRLNDAELIAELADSKKILEDVIGKEVVSFAYPYGDFDERIVAAVKLAGFKVACTTASGWALTDQDLLRVRRLTVFGSDSLSTFARNLVFADNDMNWFKMSRYYLQRLKCRITGVSH